MRARKVAFALSVVVGIGLAPRAAAQKPARQFRVGVLVPRRRPVRMESDFLGQIPIGLRELGYAEGERLLLEWRFADGDYTRLPELAQELVRIPVDLILTEGTPATAAAHKATLVIPIVFVSVGDPIGTGFVKTLSHPGGNMTGLSLLGPDTATKLLEMLRSVSRDRGPVAVLWNSANPSSLIVLESLRNAAHRTNTPIVEFEARNSEEILKAFGRMPSETPRALLVAPDQLFLQEAGEIARRAVGLRIPSMGNLREFTEAGGLMSYGSDRWDNCHRAAAYVGKILEGASPGDLPVEQPAKFELVINRKTAKALGLTIPPDLLVLADKVIE